ncbi:TIGR03503 family protein [Vibrio sp. CAIM 722]|uniref:TIGR03503 family protein n=1 Tax=Vibrio eleionomae TaxID=2653505 RepID=A0A7X4RT29_9VIBR|nr:TIGR03503 family protein [Vibrio eleionomae]MZI91644.1 TIGR03503 family protein [Vibrio eleionomae]
MWKGITGFLTLVISFNIWAAGPSVIHLLDNRFRVDPSIDQITFVIYREKSSRPVVLVRPDGHKYYAWKAPDNVRWYQEPSIDIISIEKPMPGPWQAVGKVTPENHIKLISNLKLSSDSFPDRVYQGEEIKFTARLTSDDKPLQLRDFLDRVKLKVTFTKFIENEAALAKEARPIPDVIGEFEDDGRGLDEKAGDGVFTVGLKIHSKPGKYRVRITSGNGVFLRAQESEVLVYPTPYEATFIQSRQVNQPHQIVLSGEQGMLEPGSLATQIDHKDPKGAMSHFDGQSEPDSLKVSVNIPNSGEYGQYTWSGTLYANDLASKRPLVFPISEQSYSIVHEVDLEQTRLMQEKEAAERKKIELEKAQLQARSDARKRGIMMIAIGNVVVILLALLVWFVVRKIKAKKALQPELQLDMPKK